MRILGIDPGTLVTGYGLIDSTPTGLVHVCHGLVKTRTADPLPSRLHVIFTEISTIADELGPDVLSIEQCFVKRNVQSALKLGHTRGVIMIACVARGLDVYEYAPSEIKNAVTGSGRADKHQVAEMVRVILRLPKTAPADASDALAAAICHAHGSKLRGLIRTAKR